MCRFCGKEFNRNRLVGGRLEGLQDYNTRKYCSRDCFFMANTGKNHWYWKGGVRTRPDGYIRRSSDDKYIHRVVMEKHLGRSLRSDEHVHHIDGDNTNNDIDNLELITNSSHRRIHTAKQKRDRLGRFSK